MYGYVLLILVIVCAAFLYVNMKAIMYTRSKKIEKFTEVHVNKENSNSVDTKKQNETSSQLEKNTKVDGKQDTTIEYDFSNKNVEIKKSCMGDRGAFATRNLRKGDIVEVCPVILEKRENIKNDTEIDDYVFSSGKKGEVAIAFGYCSLFNHDDDYNVEWQVDPISQKIVLKASKDIKEGDEMFIDYGKKYWSARNKNVVSCSKGKDKASDKK